MLHRRFGGRSAGLLLGIGDDAAVIAPRGAREHWVVTTDLLLEGIDFERGWMPAEALGHKALAVNLSDLAAMGARPRFYTVALGLPEDITRPWIARLYAGMTALAHRHGARLIGGDLSRSRAGIHVSVTAIGETSGRRYVQRSGARPGDLLFVTGVLGRAAAGLRLLASAPRRRGRLAREAIDAQRRPEPRSAVGEWLAGHGFARAMLDLSDGLSTDLPRLCRASGTGAEVDLPCLPLFEPAASWGYDPVELALDGGEDFELLFAVRELEAARFEAAYPPHFPRLTRIGRVTRRPGVRSRPEPGGRPTPLPPRGFDHFRKRMRQIPSGERL
jgi:thiamine-monophosphate kinase